MSFEHTLTVYIPITACPPVTMATRRVRSGMSSTPHFATGGKVCVYKEWIIPMSKGESVCLVKYGQKTKFVFEDGRDGS
jgi:hypothetical protein